MFWRSVWVHIDHILAMFLWKISHEVPCTKNIALGVFKISKPQANKVGALATSIIN